MRRRSPALAGHPKAANALHRLLADDTDQYAWLLVWKKTRKALGRPLTKDEQSSLDGSMRYAKKNSARVNKRAQKLWKRVKPGVAARQLEIGARTGKRP